MVSALCMPSYTKAVAACTVTLIEICTSWWLLPGSSKPLVHATPVVMTTFFCIIPCTLQIHLLLKTLLICHSSIFDVLLNSFDDNHHLSQGTFQNHMTKISNPSYTQWKIHQNLLIHISKHNKYTIIMKKSEARWWSCDSHVTGSWSKLIFMSFALTTTCRPNLITKTKTQLKCKQ